MSCDELKERYELYAMGALDPAERRDLDEHLARRCPDCLAGVHRARQLAASLAYAAPPVEPPRRLRNRLVAAVAPDPQKTAGGPWLTHAWATFAVLMLVAVIWYGHAARQREAQIAVLNTRLENTRTTNAELTARNHLLSEALALVNLPDARQLVFGATDREPPRGRIWVHPRRGVLLLASRLPAAPAGKIYEMWVVPKDAPPVPAGLFHSDERGEATHFWPQAVDLPSTAAIAVTLEPEAGVPAPTTTPVIAAPVGS